MSEIEFDEKTLKIAGEKIRMEILKILNKKKTISINELSKIMGKHRSTINRHLLKLVEVGLVDRTEVVKGSFVYSLSSKGLALIEHVEKYGIMPEVRVEILKERRLPRIIKSIFKLVMYTIPVIFFAIGIAGLVAQAEVRFLSRIIWFLLFAFISVTSFLIFRKVFKY